MVSGPEYRRTEYYESVRIDKNTVQLDTQVSKEEYYKLYSVYENYNKTLKNEWEALKRSGATVFLKLDKKELTAMQECTDILYNITNIPFSDEEFERISSNMKFCLYTINF